MTYFDTKNIKNKTAVWFRQHQPLIKQGLPIVAALAIVLVGYVYVKNIKTEQLASAEQVAGSPESGAKSRISELYDALVAQNKGSDTDVSGLTVAQGDWGAKWNRIKTAALKGSLKGDSGSPFVSNDPEVDFVDPYHKLEWSYPLSREGDRAVSKPLLVATNDNSVGWSWDASGENNRAVGNKTASQVCQSLGSGWRLPSENEQKTVHFKPVLKSYSTGATGTVRWTSNLSLNNPNQAVYYRWADGWSHLYDLNAKITTVCVRNKQ